MTVLSSLVYAREAHASLLQTTLPGQVIRVMSVKELHTRLGETRAVVFADVDLLPRLGMLPVPVIAILDCKPAECLQSTVRLLAANSWLSHVITTSLLSTPHARAHLTVLLERLAFGIEQDLLVGGTKGRVALLASASRRTARFDRMREFFSKFSLSERTIGAILEVAEELVMNALYDAPAEAGYFHRPRERVEDVELPPELACEISYGMEHDTAFVRLRDPFGALLRTRLVEVLSRCTGQNDVTLDESRGGAGLGLWRVFSVASTVALTVVPGSLTEVLVGIRIKDGRGARKQMQAVHLFFAPKSEDYELLAIVPDDDHAMLDDSITLIRVA